MKTYEIKPYDFPVQIVRAASVGEAFASLQKVSREIEWWRVIPTARQIRKTKNMMRCI